MPSTITAPMSASLTDRAMLITLSIRQWSATKHDKRVTKEVSDNHGSDVNMGRYNKSLLAKDALDKIKKVSGAARLDHYARTLPWADNGARILTSAGYFDYCKAMQDHRAEYDSAVDHFIQAYERYVLDAKGRLNGLFDPSDYPGIEWDGRGGILSVSTSTVRACFQFSVSINPLPDSADFRVQLGDEVVEEIRRDIAERQQSVIDTAMRDVWTRVHAVVSHMSERLAAFQNNGDKVINPFRDSLVSNIAELVDLLPSLNLTGDAELSRIAGDMKRSLLSYSADELREQDSVRERVKADADRILATVGDFI